METSCGVIALLLTTLLSSSAAAASAAFIHQPKSRVVNHGKIGQKTCLNAEGFKEVNKRLGCGLAPPSGNLELYDPNEEGKLQGTNQLQDRVSLASEFSPIPEHTIPSSPDIVRAENWLEHYHHNNLPLNFAKPSAPVTATVLGRARIIGQDAPGDIEHIVMKLPEGMHYVEGQSLSVIPPGTNPTNGKKHAPRLYSIASTRYGDMLDGNTVSLCVRRAEYWDPITNQVDDTKKGVCSNFLCDAVPGTVVEVAGPVGKTMLLPEDNNRDVIMVATGTGIAPFRGFMHRLFMENTVSRHLFGGTAWLVLGVPVTSGLLYQREFEKMKENATPGSLKIDYAISREMKNQSGGKMYVQDVIAQNADDIFHRLFKSKNKANMYFCGLKGMMPPILETFEKIAEEKGMDWNAMMKELKANNQWHVEVY
mmetsp:Transcript_36909/g.54199  ORF Transcript_36909/g.54199 Transcript_36909/m.54199 type:complete len:423 (+) Transcript_36909:19-1287(+)|eukprot:CAMPEP_0195517490 /NCGR_PEP_ID=MMETSP0794_2-20130614/10974_1 /TAXON_ID=515487 /ORGANISM="Stephanopyxis turris, Strain CCMP 815" /LENGTH=422 /DNA_ID=CAMNT_0040646305 /DNA_START=18 /DNA_END=1286 /DNA_ORIENTATION=+